MLCARSTWSGSFRILAFRIGTLHHRVASIPGVAGFVPRKFLVFLIWIEESHPSSRIKTIVNLCFGVWSFAVLGTGTSDGSSCYCYFAGILWVFPWTRQRCALRTPLLGWERSTEFGKSRWGGVERLVHTKFGDDRCIYVYIIIYIVFLRYIYIYTYCTCIYIEYMLHLFDILWNIIQNRWLKYNGWSIRSSWIRSFYKILSPWSRKLLPLQERDAIRIISLRILDALLLPPYINFYFVIIPCWYFAQDANVSVQILTHTMLIDITPHWF